MKAPYYVVEAIYQVSTKIMNFFLWEPYEASNRLYYKAEYLKRCKEYEEMANAKLVSCSYGETA